MQGSQQEEERNLESHNRITLSEVISLNLTICRVMGEKNGKREKETFREKGERNEVGAFAARERGKKKKRRDTYNEMNR